MSKGSLILVILFCLVALPILSPKLRRKMGVGRELSNEEKISVLRAAELCLTQRQAEDDEWELRDAIEDGLYRRGWWFANVGLARERSITAIFAEVVDLGYGIGEDARIDPVGSVERWASTKTTPHLCRAIRQVISYLQQQK